MTDSPVELLPNILSSAGMDLATVSELADEYLWSLEGGAVAAPAAKWSGLRESHIDAPGNTTRALYLTQGASAGSQEALVLGLVKHIVGGTDPILHVYSLISEDQVYSRCRRCRLTALSQEVVQL